MLELNEKIKTKLMAIRELRVKFTGLPRDVIDLVSDEDIIISSLNTAIREYEKYFELFGEKNENK